ncbi:hypothetical protein AURDEDRAFT_186148 [Auricularia subglabra TFB-10046 SS5]|nr:hypothetical protein AURDEDRAFT_186148 [Auricularia subglabra TFB-10046 SS5]
MSGISAEQQVVKQIRCDNGVDADLVQQARRDPVVWNTVTKLKEKLEKSLQILSEELYSKPAHFVLELLQNADDNSYAPGTTPEMRIVLRPSHMEIRCNETGFTAENVKAFCGIGQSTKRNQTGYIGEKGIGAKSMFKVARKVHVHSLGYHFVLDRDAELGMISPQWTGSSENLSGWTLLRLDFCDDKQYAIVKSQLGQVRESVLLFMRRLARLTVDDSVDKSFSVERQMDGKFLTISVKNGWSMTCRQFLRVANTIPAYRHEPKREHSETTEIVLAFPLNASREPLVSRQMVHAFLPVRSVGFKFIIQADFLTAANREDVLSDLEWNKTLRSGVVEAFCSAVTVQFQSMPTLDTTWLHFLPDPSDVADQFFSPITRDIRSRIESLKVIKDADGFWRTPSLVRFPSAFSETTDGAGIVPEPELPFYYASNQYTGGLASKAQALGVADMTFNDFLSGLIKMGDRITRKGNVWLERVCSLIYTHGFNWNSQLRDRRIRDLPLARLANGNWISYGISAALFFNRSSSEFPSGLGIDILCSDASAPRRRELLERLGARDIDCSAVVSKIIEVHRRPWLLSAGQVVEHVVYVFDNQRSITSTLSARSLCLVDTDGVWAYGGDLYMDVRDASGVVLSSILPSPARFIHSRLMSPSPHLLSSRRVPELLNWLQSTFGVSAAPRVSSGEPQTEFKGLVDSLCLSDCGRLLSLLRHFWPGISAQVSREQDAAALNAYFASLEVLCLDGRTAPLASTFVLNRLLKHFATPDLLVLPVPDPDGDWLFLRNFGVSMDVDAKFFLKRLLALAGSPSAKKAQVYALYQQLSARFLECPEDIRNAFGEPDSALFFVDGDWYCREDVVWHGPGIMTLKVALEPYYPPLKELFSNYLRVPDAQPAIIADELRSFSKQHAGRGLCNDELETLSHLLSYADYTIELVRDGRCEDWTTGIRDVAILPVESHVTGSVALVAPDEETFFIRDPSGVLSGLFSGALSFLALSQSDVLLRFGNLLAHLGLDDRRLESHVSPTVLLDDVPLCEGSYLGTVSDLETAEYMAALPFLARVHYRRAKSAKSLIRSITVHEVETITVTYTIDDPDVAPVSQPKASWASFDNSGSLRLFIASHSRWARKDRFIGVVDAIVKALNLRGDQLNIATILRSDDADELDSLLTEAGFPALDQKFLSQMRRGEEHTDHSFAADGLPGVRSRPLWDLAHSQSKPRGDHISNRPAIAVSPKASLQASTAPISSSPSSLTVPASAATNSIDNYVQSIQGREEINRIKAAAIQTSLPSVVALDSPASSAIDLPDIEHAPVRTDVESGKELEALGLSSISIRASKRGGSQGQSYEDARMKEIGFLGEQFVFQLLSRYLDDCTTPFTYENWTSSFRSLAGFPPFLGDEVADFVYHDTDGVLTQRLFPFDQDFLGSPKYFIEVKSTSGDQSKPFFMKKRQFLEAFRMSRSNSDESAPLQLYVLFRVSSIGGHGTPVLKPYVDPHDMLSRGTLRIESDSVQVRIVGE